MHRPYFSMPIKSYILAESCTSQCSCSDPSAQEGCPRQPHYLLCVTPGLWRAPGSVSAAPQPPSQLHPLQPVHDCPAWGLAYLQELDFVALRAEGAAGAVMHMDRGAGGNLHLQSSLCRDRLGTVLEVPAVKRVSFYLCLTSSQLIISFSNSEK